MTSASLPAHFNRNSLRIHFPMWIEWMRIDAHRANAHPMYLHVNANEANSMHIQCALVVPCEWAFTFTVTYLVTLWFALNQCHHKWRYWLSVSPGRQGWTWVQLLVHALVYQVTVLGNEHISVASSLPSSNHYWRQRKFVATCDHSLPRNWIINFRTGSLNALTGSPFVPLWLSSCSNETIFLFAHGVCLNLILSNAYTQWRMMKLLDSQSAVTFSQPAQ